MQYKTNRSVLASKGTHHPCPISAWWLPAPLHWACTLVSAWPCQAPAWRWTHCHPDPGPWTPPGSLPRQTSVRLNTSSGFSLVVLHWEMIAVICHLLCTCYYTSGDTHCCTVSLLKALVSFLFYCSFGKLKRAVDVWILTSLRNMTWGQAFSFDICSTEEDSASEKHIYLESRRRAPSNAYFINNPSVKRKLVAAKDWCFKIELECHNSEEHYGCTACSSTQQYIG